MGSKTPGQETRGIIDKKDAGMNINNDDEAIGEDQQTSRAEENREDLERSAIVAAFMHSAAPIPFSGAEKLLHHNTRRRGLAVPLEGSGKGEKKGLATCTVGSSTSSTDADGGGDDSKPPKKKAPKETTAKRGGGAIGTMPSQRQKVSLEELSGVEETQERNIGGALDLEGFLANLRAHEGEAVLRIDELKVEVNLRLKKNRDDRLIFLEEAWFPA